jgi:molecular chaperone DnaK
MAEIAVGIDLGTSNSCVAAARGKQVEVLTNAYGENVTASVVHFATDGAVVVGNPARAALIHDPHHTVASAKRLIGRYSFSEEVKKARAVYSYEIVDGPGHSVRIKVREEQFSLSEIAAMVLREMKGVAERKLGCEVTQAVITVPAYFNDSQRQATKDAGRIAGLEVLRLINEPTAAALAYGFGRGLAQRVAVYDLGGGTFDISILEIGKDVFEVLATCGDTYLGGDDFDDRVIDLLADEFVAKHGVNVRKDPFALEKLKFAAENAKRALSVVEEAEIRIPEIVKNEAGEALTLQHTLNVREFTTLVGDLVQRTFKVCDEALAQAGLVPSDLDGVILVGGPTRLPLVREAVAGYFGQAPKTDVDPDEVVAKGAAIHAATLAGGAGEDAFLLDVTPLSLRIGVAGGLAETVIERNTQVPIEQTRSFTTYQDNQESVKIRVHQGESRKADENELLGQFEFGGLQKAPRGQVRIDVTFSINSDGMVNVTARDRDSGREASTSITLSSGLSAEEIDSIVAENPTDRVTLDAPPEPAPLEPGPGPGVADGAPPAASPEEAQSPVMLDEAPEALLDDDAGLAVLDDADIEALLESDGSSAVEPNQLGKTPDDVLASAPPEESLFEEGEFDLSADDTLDPAGS